MKNLISGVAFALLLTSAAPALAHHSIGGLYDARDSSIVKVSGTLKKIDWINPHIFLLVDVAGADGKITTYNFENFPPSFWRQRGIGKSAFKVGDKITVEAYPARDKTNTIGFAKVIHFADGRTIATMTAESAQTAR
jgi:Family of unknown function (DUF6152)